MPLQLHQNLNLLLLAVVGSLFANIYISWSEIALIIIFTLSIEHLFLYFNKGRSFYFSYSGLSTAISAIVLMYSPNLWIYFIVITLGLAQKHFITFGGKQLFNPSNFALIMALLFFYRDSHIISGQLGDEPWLALIASVLAFAILVRANRWVISVAFIIAYLLLQYFLIIGYDPVILFEDIYHRFYSVTFILFIYFMLTDPPVTPSSYKEQILFAILVALMATLLDRYFGYRVQHLFMSVFFFSFFVHYRTFKTLSSREITYLVTIFCLMVGVLFYIELQPPYYFEMNG